MSEILANQEQLQEVCNAVRNEQARREAEGVLPIRICMGASCIASAPGASGGARGADGRAGTQWQSPDL